MSAVIERALGRLADGLDPQPHPLAHDPVEWVKRRTGEFVWSKQREIMESVRDNRKTAVPSGHGIGKSFIASEIICWWLDTHPDAFVVTSAPSAHQVKAILWREIKRRHAKSGMEGHITDGDPVEWKINGELVAFGRKPADYTDEDKAATAFQGIHALHVLIVLDEAAGIPGWLWTAATTLITNERSRILAIGNPTDPTGQFEKVCRPGSGWNVIPISVFDSPNFTGEFAPAHVLEMLVGHIWEQEVRRAWGEGSPLYIARALGRFPEIGDDQLFSPSLIRACQERDLPGIAHGRYAADIARYGKDYTSVYRNREGVIRKVKSWAKKDTKESANLLAGILRPHNGGVPIVIDSIGVGAGVYDNLRHSGFPAIPFDAGSRASDPRRYVNLRAEQWWLMKTLAESEVLDLPPEGEDDDLIAQLGAIKFKIDSAGRIGIEKKEETAKRVGRSPDNADAAMMTTFAGVGLADWLEEAQNVDLLDAVPEITAGLMEERF